MTSERDFDETKRLSAHTMLAVLASARARNVAPRSCGPLLGSSSASLPFSSSRESARPPPDRALSAGFLASATLTDASDTDRAVELLTTGPGFCVFPDLFSAELLSAAQASIMREIDVESGGSAMGAAAVHGETGHSQIYADSSADGTADQGVRVWNLLAKGAEFEAMAQEPHVMAVADRILGDDFCLGSFASNSLFPGAGHQNPHLDYPYWDMNGGSGRGRGAWPVVPKGGHEHAFFMNLQMAVMLDDFTLDNGGTA